ncbi:MFS transporter [Actinokineospora fastidiosa]|uniref:MFS transporter n=1 Tax=Actinokineospora fastidiosa TaxID=1816 RepID=A0A918GER5_9PSEU|nr:MFS transporter [Actinokineospora fastidiosa]GGS32257.1 MFS transporter [Actinokineospora fastidiosa]
MGRDFAWLWRAYAVSSLGTWLALDAFPLIAILALHASPAQVSLVAAVGAAAGALLAVPLGPWLEFRAKRPVMVRADLVRFAVLLSVPAAHLTGVLTYGHLLVVAAVVAVADIAFVGASGAHLKALVGPDHLMAANARFENATWITTAVGPPLGGALIGLLGPVVTVTANAVSYVGSALGIGAIRAPEPPPPGRPARVSVTDGWRTIAADPVLRRLFANTVAVSALIMAAAPVLTYLMIHDLGFTPLQYGLAIGVPCLGGVVGARAARPLARRFGDRRVLLAAGVSRVLWLAGLAAIGGGVAGLLTVMAVQTAIVTSMGVFTPVLATYRLRRTPDGELARVLTAWTITTRTAIAAATALWGVVAAVTGPRVAIAVAGVLLAATALLLPWRALTRSPSTG